jgi:hypothetical protein
MARGFTGAFLAATLLVWGGEARGQADKRACLATYVETQSNRQQGRLLAARAAAMTCGNDACPPVLRSDCVAWLRELDAAIPTVVFSASTPDGRDVTDVRVTIDGGAVVDGVAGGSVAMDPGEHVVGCEVDGAKRVELHLVAAEGVKNRPVHFDIELAARAPAPRSATGSRPIRPATFVLGALGAVGLGVWAAVGASAFWGSPSVETLNRCKPNCDRYDRSDVQRKLDVADVAGGAALVALGGALALYLTRPVVVVPVPDGAVGTWTTRF